MFDETITRIIRYAYPELVSYRVRTRWARMNAYGMVRWNSGLREIDLKMDYEVRHWHDAQVTGLLAHEFSHVVLGGGRTESSVDGDVIKRGLGVYLAIERLLSGCHEDHIIKRGADRYLSYRSIRERLDSEHLQQLDQLLYHLRAYPRINRPRLTRDVCIQEYGNLSKVMVSGHVFILNALASDARIELIEDNGTVVLLVDDEVVSWEW